MRLLKILSGGLLIAGFLLDPAKGVFAIEAPVITSSLGTCGSVNTAQTYQITADNGPVVYSASGLPPGVTLNPTTNAISGAASTAGYYNVLITASNSAGTAQTSTTLGFDSFVFAAGPIFTGPQHMQATVSVPFSSQLTTLGPAHNFIAYGLPPGLSVDVFSGFITGTPIKQGTYYVRLAMQTFAGNTCGGTGIFEITVSPHSNALPGVTNPPSAHGQAEVAFIYQISASNNPISFTAAGLPPGLTMDSNGFISGTPGTSGTFTALVGAYNSEGWGGMPLTLTIDPAAVQTPVITSPLTVQGISGTSITVYHITATGGVTSYSVSSLPLGLNFDAALANIYGTPASPGTFPVTITASNSTGPTSATLSISIAPAGTPPPVVTQPRPGSYLIGDATANAGSDVDVPVYYTPSPDENEAEPGFNVLLPTHVTLVDFTLGPAATDPGFSPIVNPPVGNVFLFYFGFTRVGPGLLGTMHLHIDSGTPSETVSVSLSGTDSLYYVQGTNQYLPIPMPVLDGTLTINAAPVVNQPPQVSACSPPVKTCPPLVVVGPTVPVLSGAALDEGLPLTGQLTTSWSQVSGPGIVTFGNMNALNTTANVSVPGTYVVLLTASDGSLSNSANITVTVNQPLTVSAISASQNPVTGTQTTLSPTVLGGIPPFTYLWSQPASTSLNTSAAGPTVTFTQAGTYSFSLTVTDSVGTLAAQTLNNVKVILTQTTLLITPPAGSLQIGQTYSFAAQAFDQFANPMTPQPGFVWSVLQPGASMDAATGQFTANAPGTYTVQAVANNQTSTVQATVGAPLGLPTPMLKLPATLPLNSRIVFSYSSPTPIDHFEWLFTPLGSAAPSAFPPANESGSAPAAGTVSWSSASPDTDLAIEPLQAGPYRVSVTAVDANALRSNPGIAVVSLVSTDLNGIKVYPNPWRSDKHQPHPITFAQLSAESRVDIFTASGHLVQSLSGSATIPWNLKTSAGDDAASGLYIYVVTDSQGNKARGKLAIIR